MNAVAWPAHNNRGNQLLEDAQEAKASASNLLDEAKLKRLDGRDAEAKDLTYDADTKVQDARGMLAEAEKEFRIALELFPHYTEAHNNLGYIYSMQGRYKEAEAEFRAALADQPDFESAQLNLAALLRVEAAQRQQQQPQPQAP